MSFSSVNASWHLRVNVSQIDCVSEDSILDKRLIPLPDK